MIEKMDAKIQRFIEEQRDYIDARYELPPQERRQAEAMFERLADFGAECRNFKDFNEQFHHRTMSQEFYSMLLNFASYIKSSVVEEYRKTNTNTNTNTNNNINNH